MAARSFPMVPASFAVKVRDEVRAIQARVSSPSNGKIRLIGNHTIELPDGTQCEELEMVIVDFATVNMYFDQPYSPAMPVPPACFSIGFEQHTMKPSPNSPDAQADGCTQCPLNQFGSAGRGKACKNTRLLAVMGVKYDEEDQDPPMWTLSIPPVSLKFFDAYVLKLATRMKTIPMGVVTRMKLKEDVAYPCPTFEAVRPLREDEYDTYMLRKEEARDVLMIEPDTSSYQPPRQMGRGFRR